jgi:Mce-associated membrane protein
MSQDVDTETAEPVTPPGWTPVATPPQPPPPAARKGLGGGLLAALVLTALGVALLIAAVVVTQIRLHNANAEGDARATALVAAKTFSAELSTYDYHHLDRDFGAVVNHSTGKFKTDFSKASKDLEPLITKYQATSAGKVAAAGISDDATTDPTNHATVIVFVDQTVRNTNSPQPRVDRNRLRLTLTHASGSWLVEKVEIL